MIRHFSSRRCLLVATGLFAFCGLTLALYFFGAFSRPRSLPIQDRPPTDRVQLASFSQDAEPSLEGGEGWINSGPIHLADLKGKIVLLDFWTYCCINCHHVLPTLARLEAKYKNELVIIGVHSGKFDAEKNTENIRRKVAEYRIKHPVINDANMVIWERFQVSSWPTLVLITPDGKFGGSRSGEVPFEQLDHVIGQVVDEVQGSSSISSRSNFPPKRTVPPKAPCSIPARSWPTQSARGSSFPTLGTTASS